MSKQPRVPIHDRPLKKYVSEEQLKIKSQIAQLRSSLNQNIEYDEPEEIKGTAFG